MIFDYSKYDNYADKLQTATRLRTSDPDGNDNAIPYIHNYRGEVTNNI